MYAQWKDLIDSLRGEAPLLTLSGTEEVKTLRTARGIWKKLWQYRTEKGQALLGIGGGSLLDVGGFCAATWKRGIPFISVPTTFVAQIDAAIGGKTALNFKSSKNLLGVYAEPQAIWSYRGFLATLSPRDLRSGWVEALKHALLVGGALWEALFNSRFTSLPEVPLLEALASVKIDIVTQDPHEEKRIRFVLNLGHTLGHVWEALSAPTDSPLTHGEAVAIGLLQEAYVSLKRGILSSQTLSALQTKLEQERLVTSLPPFTWKEWEKKLLQDKKIRNGQLYLPLLHGIGRVEVEPVTVEELREATRWYRYLTS